MEKEIEGGVKRKKKRFWGRGGVSTHRRLLGCSTMFGKSRPERNLDGVHGGKTRKENQRVPKWKGG